jgi:hypothetical protein
MTLERAVRPVAEVYVADPLTNTTNWLAPVTAEQERAKLVAVTDDAAMPVMPVMEAGTEY